jgi:hypothetical protein
VSAPRRPRCGKPTRNGPCGKPADHEGCCLSQAAYARAQAWRTRHAKPALPPATPADEMSRAATLVIRRHASSPDEARELLAMCGLTGSES